MTDDLFRLVYCSRAAVADQGPGQLPAAEIERIAALSRRNNARDGVTGAMLCTAGCFAQVIEGGLDDVQRTFERIQCDPRHTDVVVLRAEPAGHRLFGGWDMALADAAGDAGAGQALAGALLRPDERTGADILALLDGLVRREAEWSPAAVPAAARAAAPTAAC